MNEIKDKIPSRTGLTTIAALNDIKIKISDISDLLKNIFRKYFITFDNNKFTNSIFGAKIKNKTLINDISEFINNSDLNEQIKKKKNTNKSRNKSRAR